MGKIQLQLAMDGGTARSIEAALEIIKNTADYLDIIEVGTSFVLHYGMEAVARFKSAHPNKKILADMKIMDGGYHNAAMGCRAGGDIITVLGVADRETIRSATQAIHENGSEIMVDFICVKNVEETIAFCEEIGVDYICVHSGVDMQSQGKDPYDDLKRVITLTEKCKVAVAGGINENTVDSICRVKPDVVIVGGAIYKQENYIEAAAGIRASIDKVCEEMYNE